MKNTARPALFQFHKGTIKTSNCSLKLEESIIFQFHKGTIKTDHEIPIEEALQDFNSIKVRLKRS